MKELRVIFAGGGTGGHLFPALAIADRLKERVEPEYKAVFRFVGTKRGLEYRLRDKLGYPLSLISVRGIARSGLWRNLIFPFLLIAGLLKSIYLILRINPAVVIGTGGYVMGPVIMAAIALNRRSLIQEQNSYPGLTTRQLAAKVDLVCLGFPAAAAFLKGSDLVETGNPVKKDIGRFSRDEACRYFGLKPDLPTILIIGGSQGAFSINNNIAAHLADLDINYQIIWQTGERAYKEVSALAGGRVKGRALFAFLDRMELAYAAADIAIARAGALTLAELEAAARPAILVPYPYAAGDHQRKNAEYFEKQGAAVIIDDSRLDQLDLLARAAEIIKSGRIEKMKNAVEKMRDRRQQAAVDLITDKILELTDIKKEQ